MPDQTSSSPLELLFNISRELASALELRVVLQRILFESLKYVGGERASIVVLDDNGKVVDSAIVFGQKINNDSTQTLRDTVERGLAGWVVRNRKPAWIPDTSRDERWLRRPDDAANRSGAKCALCVPLLAREHVVGVLTLVHPVPGSYNQEHFSLVQAIADLSGIAVLNASLYAESRRQARVNTALAASAAAINASLDLEDVLQKILKEIIQALQVETVALALVEPNWDIVFDAATGKNKDAILGKRVKAGQGISGFVVHEGEGVVIPVVADDKRIVPGEQFAGFEAHAMVIAPIYAQSRVIGLLEAINPISGAFDPDALLVLEGIGNLAGSAIQHAQTFGQLQAAHLRYHELFDDSVDPIFLSGWDGKIHEANRQAAVITGCSTRELQGMNIDEMQKLSRGNHLVDYDRLKAGDTISYETVLKAKNGLELPIQVNVRKVVFEEAESLQWLMRDISERKKLDALREDLASMIYHDLRSPLANVVSSLDLISTMFSGPGNETVESITNIARRSTDRIQRLINSLLDINRLEAGQPIVSRKAVMPSVLVGEAMDAVSLMVVGRHQALSNLIPGDLPPILVDPDMVRRVLINLLENASKYTPPEGRIEIGGRLEGDWVQMWVKDDGPGIPQPDQEHIFDKYTRLKGQENVSGFGVGLAFCRLAVNGHGGRIWVESQTGHGATFNLTLPMDGKK